MSRHADPARHVARRLLRWYPKPWRIRYGVEMRELVDEMPVRWRQVADLAIGAVREWMSPRAFGWPARSAAHRIQFVRGCKFVVAFLILDVVARLTAGVLTTRNASLPAGFEMIAVLLYVVCMLRVGAGILFDDQKWMLSVPRPWLGRMGHAELAFWSLALFAFQLAIHVDVTTSRGLNPYLQLWLWGQMLFLGSARSRRLRQVFSSHRRRVKAIEKSQQRFW
jgi:hypothetical protein